MSSGTSANLLMFHTCCVTSGKSLNLSELQVPLLRNRDKSPTLCCPGFVWGEEEVAEADVVTLTTGIKLILSMSPSGPRADAVTPSALCVSVTPCCKPPHCAAGPFVFPSDG